MLYSTISCSNLIAFNSCFPQLYLILFMGHALILINENTTMHAYVEGLDSLCTNYSFEKQSILLHLLNNIGFTPFKNITNTNVF